MEIDPSLRWLLAAVLVLYLVVMYGIGLFANRNIHSTEDFVVAGRRLPLSLSWMTLLATWFGAGTILTAADEVRHEGLQATALDPLGAGCCLLLAGLFVAGPMWRMKLLTVPDFFKRKFGSKAELVSSLILVPSYFGWIAAQFTALAGVLELFFEIPMSVGILLVAIVGTGYTLMGGMWSVTLTDAVQITLVLGGLLVLGTVVLVELGYGPNGSWTSVTPYGTSIAPAQSGGIAAGFEQIITQTPPEKLILIPHEDHAALLGWLGVFAIGALGNLPGQDLMQRIFSAKSDKVARGACLIAGVMYLAFGVIPILLALAGDILIPEDVDKAILPALAHAFLHPAVAVVFLVAVLSAILSTIDSAILSPATVLAQNVFPRFIHSDTLAGNRWAVLLVAVCSTVLAYLGDSAYELLEEAYLMTLVGLFIPLMLGLYTSPHSGKPALASMLTGTTFWAVHFANGWGLFLQPIAVFESAAIPLSIGATLSALLAYCIFEPPWAWKSRQQ